MRMGLGYLALLEFKGPSPHASVESSFGLGLNLSANSGNSIGFIMK